MAVVLMVFAAIPAVGQSQQVRLNTKSPTVKMAINVIGKQTGMSVDYAGNALRMDRKMALSSLSLPLSELMESMLDGTGYTYSISGRHIVVEPKQAKSQEQRPQQQDKMRVSGRILDENGEPIIGATVKEKGTGNGTVTDLDGNFSLEVEKGSRLVVSYIGYTTSEVAAKNSVNLSLGRDLQELDEVVVVGYGTQKKRDLTGAISSVKGGDLELDGVASVAHALSGKAAGLYIKQNSAQPGGGVDILVRGAGSVNAGNDPLYVVDGFPVAKLDQSNGGDTKMDPGTQSVLNFLNPNDIESIEVLKDASATSIYGARAANGVVLITTKRGKTGAPRLNYAYNYTFQKYSDTYDMLSLGEWMQMRNEISMETWMWNNQVAPYGTNTMAQAQAQPQNGVGHVYPYTEAQISAAGVGTDWLGLITRNGSVDEHNVSLQGGSDKTQYMLSFNYYKNNGIIRNSGMTRYTLKANIDQAFLNIFKAGLNLTMTRINNQNTQLGSGQYENSGIIRSAVAMSPEVKAYDEELKTYPVNPLQAKVPNPYSLLTNTDNGRTNRLLANLFVEARPLKELLLRVNLGIDHANMDRKTYQPRTTVNGNDLSGVAYIYNKNNDQYLAEATATYTKQFADIHSLNLLAGTSYEQFNYDDSELGNNNFLTDAFLYNNIDAGAGTKIVKSNATKNTMQSFFLRAAYVLKDRYLLTATLRADGASVFAKNNKWGYFPSVALGWTASEEPFLRNVNWLSNLKFRLSWGQTGNADIGTNAFASYLAESAYVNGNHQTVIGVKKGKLENPDLKWETTTEWNLGVDFGFLKGRISGTVELYQRVISDLLNYRLLNTFQEVPQVMANIGKTKSHGIELTLNTYNVVTKNFEWSTNFTFTAYKDRWKERTPDWKPNIYEREDDPIRPIFSRLADHILQQGEPVPAAQPDLKPGQIVIKDIDGYKRDAQGNPVTDENGRFILTGMPDNKIDDADTKLIGTQDPGWLAGMNNTLKYKNFEFAFMFSGMFDRIMQDPTQMMYGMNGKQIWTAAENGMKSNKERWTPTNPSVKYPSPFFLEGQGRYYTAGDFFYQKAWFIRLQSVSLGYTLPKSWIAKANFISSIRLHLSANNLFVITPYTGLDPETDAYPAAYPNARSFSFGVNISL